jgi:hypothetical protein
MDNTAIHSPQQLRVTAFFGDHHQSFDLVTGTTFGQVAERLAQVSLINHSRPLGISVVFGARKAPSRKAKPPARRGHEPMGEPL